MRWIGSNNFGKHVQFPNILYTRIDYSRKSQTKYLLLIFPIFENVIEYGGISIYY